MNKYSKKRGAGKGKPGDEVGLSEQYLEVLPAPRYVDDSSSLEFLGWDQEPTNVRLVTTYGAHEDPII